MIDILKNRILKGVVTRHFDGAFRRWGHPSVLPDRRMGTDECPHLRAGLELKSLIHKKFGRSFHIREVDTGSCGACESEIISANNPIYDLQRFGINFVASPRHADALLVTGPVSKNMVTALKKTFEAMPEPKCVITLGDCALDGGIFKGSYYTEGAVGGILPVVLHIPGCPPRPMDIISAMVSFLSGEKG